MSFEYLPLEIIVTELFPWVYAQHAIKSENKVDATKRRIEYVIHLRRVSKKFKEAVEKIPLWKEAQEILVPKSYHKKLSSYFENYKMWRFSVVLGVVDRSIVKNLRSIRIAQMNIKLLKQTNERRNKKKTEIEDYITKNTKRRKFRTIEH